jgi:hypothetical protein
MPNVWYAIKSGYDGNCQTQVPMVICANKIDLEHLREVDRSEGEAVAAKANATYIETRCALRWARRMHVCSSS